MFAKNIVDEFEAQGWSDDTIICLLCEYIDTQNKNILLYDFLDDKAKFENNARES